MGYFLLACLYVVVVIYATHQKRKAERYARALIAIQHIAQNEAEDRYLHRKDAPLPLTIKTFVNGKHSSTSYGHMWRMPVMLKELVQTIQADIDSYRANKITVEIESAIDLTGN